MISLDGSIIPAIFIFLALIVALNYLLFRPLLQIQAEREGRTTGLMDQARQNLDRHLELFNRYEASIKNARMEGYQLQEQVRSEAMKKRAEALQHARDRAETLVQESRSLIESQVEDARSQLDREAREIARGIAATILQPTA